MSQSPYPPAGDDRDPNTAEPSLRSLRQMAFEYLKRAAVGSARHTVRGAIASFILSLGFAHEWDEWRLRHRYASGGRVTAWEFIFGTRFSVIRIIHTLIFLALAGGVVYYLWDQGFFAMVAEQQGMLDAITVTATAAP